MEQAVDRTGKKVGMWLFLYTEIMLFGGLFVIYANYHHRYIKDFADGGATLNLVVGTLNTVLLLTSSFTVAASISALRKGTPKTAMAFLGASILMGLLFLVNKYFEWGAKFAHGIYPGSPELAEGPHGLTIFYGLYYTITGLHGLHVVIGLGAADRLLGADLDRPDPSRQGHRTRELGTLLAPRRSDLDLHLSPVLPRCLTIEAKKPSAKMTEGRMIEASDQHPQPYRHLLAVLLGLLALTAVTVAVSRVHLGAFNVWAAILIASLKSSLVLLFFMHLKYEGQLIRTTFLVTLFTLAVLISFLFWDVSFR